MGRLTAATLVVLATTLLFVPTSGAVERPTPDFCPVSYTHLTLPTNREV